MDENITVGLKTELYIFLYKHKMCFMSCKVHSWTSGNTV